MDRLESSAMQAETLFGPMAVTAPNLLSDRFILPPFTVLDARSGEWGARKARWGALGLVSDEGRDVVVFGGTGDGNDEVTDKIRSMGVASVFDPVVTELSYAWYTQPGASILDPFAGGPVRGLVASYMDRRYVGVDLRPEQVGTNRERAATLPNERTQPTWVVGDATDVDVIPGEVWETFDFAFTCPPYGWLERYSDDPADLSNMDRDAFLRAHAIAIANTALALRPDRFATWVVGDFRDADGCYVGFPAATIAAFAAVDMRLFNEAVLLTPVGSVPLTASVNFRRGRKLGKAHQNVLTFVKGDPRRAASYAIGDTPNDV